MSKKLKIQFWKAEKVLAMQILEQEGLPRCKEEGNALILNLPALCEYDISLRGCAKWAILLIPYIGFDTNTERDAYLEKIVNTITDELFTGEGELKIGEMCEIWHPADLEWQERKLLAILPENYEERFIVMNLYDPDRYAFFSVARPIAKRTEPKIEECGQLVTYTWEEK